MMPRTFDRLVQTLEETCVSQGVLSQDEINLLKQLRGELAKSGGDDWIG